MILPSASNMKFKFPDFNSIDDASIEFAIEEAQVYCGKGEWIDDANQTLALMYYAAHLLQVSLMRLESGTGQVIQSERIGELQVTYAQQQQPSLADPLDLTMTIYGVRYLGLVQRNFPAVLTINSAVRM